MDLLKKKPTKAATKGQKEIYLANQATIKKYTLGSSAALILTFFSLIIYVPSLVCLKRMSTAKFNEKGAVIDAGCDLNIRSGFFEHIQDLVIITGTCQLLASYSIYAWWFWVLVPSYVFWLFWVNVASPWIFAPAPEEEAPEKNEKKQRKLMQRQQRAMRG